MHNQIIRVPACRLRWSITSKKVWLVALALVALLAGLMRLVPHPPNFTPMAAMALMGGLYIRDLRCALAMPLAIMGATDLAIGLHPTLPFVYASFALIVLLGRAIRLCPNLIGVIMAALTASVVFFAMTNLGHWLMAGFYPKTLGGLASCYGAALGLFGYTVAGDLFFSICFFGVLAGLRNRSGR